MGIEDWVLKGTKLITNTKKQRLKILTEVRFSKIQYKKKKKKPIKQTKNTKSQKL